MTDKSRYVNSYSDEDWGCDYFEVEITISKEKIKVCHVKVNDIQIISKALAQKVLDTSWMTNLDKGIKRAYDRTVQETAAALVNIFESTSSSSELSSEFGEVMVSIGSAKALEKIFSHVILPIAELWKPQIKQNEGFDFHTICPEDFINFGEAKYSGSVSPHGNAINQAVDFISKEKHLRDFVHLKELTTPQASENLNNDKFGIVVSFSINAKNPFDVFQNAMSSVQEKMTMDSVKTVYLVGVSK